MALDLTLVPGKCGVASYCEVSAKCLRSVCEVSANITMVTIVTSMVITYHYGNHGKEVSASVRRAYQ